MGLGRRRERQPPQEFASHVFRGRVPGFGVQPVDQQAERPGAEEPAIFGGILGPPAAAPHGVQGLLDLLQVGAQEIVHVRLLGRVSQQLRLHGS